MRRVDVAASLLAAASLAGVGMAFGGVETLVAGTLALGGGIMAAALGGVALFGARERIAMGAGLVGLLGAFLYLAWAIGLA